MKKYCKTNENGRSMVEMLGVLAIIGVLSVSGIAGYTYAMNKHRANEIVASVSKMAMTATTEIDLRGQPSLVEFKNLSGQIMTDGGYEVQLVDDEENGRFQLKILKVPEAVCENVMNNPPSAAVFTYAGADGTASECAEDENTLTFVFNDSMSDATYASDYGDSDSCDGAGKKWCSARNGGSGECVESDCCADTPVCKVCDAATGAISGDATYATPCDSGAGNGIDGYCVYYPTRCIVPEHGVCVTQDDCGGAGSGYYCAYRSYVDANRNSADPEVAMGCTTTNGVRTCEVTGECKPVDTSADLTQTVYGLGEVTRSSEKMMWWDAKNYCAALPGGKDLIDVKEFLVYKTNSNSKAASGLLQANAGTTSLGCADGKKCWHWNDSPWSAMWDGNTLTDAEDTGTYGGGLYKEHYSPVLIDLRVKFNSNTIGFWTDSTFNKTTQEPREKFLVDLYWGSAYSRFYWSTIGNNSTGLRALCR